METPTASTPAGGESQTALRGAVQQPVEETIDGASRTLAFGAQGKSAFGGGGALAGMSSSAIREVQTTAGNAEVDEERAAAGTERVESMHGTNGLHGQVFFFERQNSWDARNPFTQWVTETAQYAPFAPYNPALFPAFDNFQYSSGPNGSPVIGPPESYTPPDHETTWGIGVGGHIRRDRLFWFAALDGYRSNDPAVSMVKHPYLVEHPSTCTPNSPCNPISTGFFAIPSDDELQVLCARLELLAPGQTKYCTNPLVQALTPYSTMLETLAGLLGPAPRTAQQWVGFGRIDWEATERHHFTFEGIGALWDSPGGGLTRVSENYGSNSFGDSHANEQWILTRWEAFLTPNLLLTTQGSWGRDVLE